MALMRQNVFTPAGYILEPKYTQNYDPARYYDVYEKLNPQDGLSTPQYSYVIS
jgi:hypothetical protein